MPESLGSECCVSTDPSCVPVSRHFLFRKCPKQASRPPHLHSTGLQPLQGAETKEDRCAEHVDAKEVISLATGAVLSVAPVSYHHQVLLERSSVYTGAPLWRSGNQFWGDINAVRR
ncbi:unnamed protein product [Caretta caretta]